MEGEPRRLTDDEVVSKFQKGVDEGRLEPEIIGEVMEALRIAHEGTGLEQADDGCEVQG